MFSVHTEKNNNLMDTRFERFDFYSSDLEHWVLGRVDNVRVLSLILNILKLDSLFRLPAKKTNQITALPDCLH